MLRAELEAAKVIPVKVVETENVETESVETEYSLASPVFDPTKSSPPDKFIDIITLRMQKYYSENPGINHTNKHIFKIK